MKYFFSFLIVLSVFSCKKEPVDVSPAGLLASYEWYPYMETDTLFNQQRDTIINVLNVAMPSCDQQSYFQFKKEGTVVRHLPCLTPETQAPGTWKLYQDSIFVVSIPFRTSNIGFISYNNPLKLFSINSSEMKTQYITNFYAYENGVGMIGVRTNTMIYKHR